MELESRFRHIKTSNSTFYLEKTIRYVDLENLNKYTVKQLIDILGQKIGGSPRKEHYIHHILRLRKNEIILENREYRLNTLLK